MRSRLSALVDGLNPAVTVSATVSTNTPVAALVSSTVNDAMKPLTAPSAVELLTVSLTTIAVLSVTLS